MISSTIPQTTQLPLACILTTLSLLVIITYVWLIKPNQINLSKQAAF